MRNRSSASPAMALAPVGGGAVADGDGQKVRAQQPDGEAGDPQMAHLRNTKLFKERLAQLEEASQLRLVFVPAEAAHLLAERVAAVAKQFGVTERTALQTDITPQHIGKSLGQMT
jgi:hypothetical protein